MCISSIIDFCQSLLRLACQQVLGQPITDQGMPKRKLGELSEPLVESAAATEPAASEQSEGAASSSGAEAASWSLTELNDEVLLQILSSLPGWMAWRLEATGLAAWRTGCTDAWWKTRCHLEFAAERLPAPLAGSTWRQSYRQLLGVQAARTGVWCYSSQRHGLRDRVAAPQLFVNPSGEKLFCYGGWIDGGPQTDLHWVPISSVVNAAHDHSADHWRFQRAQATGTPAMPGGVQSLTPLWAESGTLDAPSRSFVAETASQLRRGGPATAACEEDAALVMAFGGGGGGYRHEHNSWAIGVLREVPGGDTTSILWGRPSAKEKGVSSEGISQSLTSHTPTPRCAHTATYLPERFTQLAEGAVLLFGGHTAHCTESLATAELLTLQDWQWQPLTLQKSDALGEDWEMNPRHGHSSTFFEVDGKGYVVVVGGGTGNILETWGVRDFSDVSVLCVETWTWIGHYQLRGEDVPGRHHTACRGLGNQLLIFGGGRRPSNQVCVLDAAACVRRALAGDALGAVELRPVHHARPSDEEGNQAQVPQGRKMHGAACLAPHAPLLVVYGGWKTGPHFSDVWTFALGADERDLEAFQPVEQQSLEEEDGDDMHESPVVGVRMMGPDGQVRMMRIPSELLSQFVRQGMVRRVGAESDD